jgi:hypothetical protein
VYTNASGTNVYMLSKNSSVTCFGSNTTVKNNGGTIVATNLSPENIKKDVEILGVTGTLESGSKTEGGAIYLHGNSGDNVFTLDLAGAKAIRFTYFSVSDGDILFTGSCSFELEDANENRLSMLLETVDYQADADINLSENDTEIIIQGGMMACYSNNTGSIARKYYVVRNTDFDLSSSILDIYVETHNRSSSEELYFEYEVIY